MQSNQTGASVDCAAVPATLAIALKNGRHHGREATIHAAEMIDLAICE